MGRRARSSDSLGSRARAGDVSPNFNPYSRADWTELQQRFRPPPNGPSISNRLRDYATSEEIDTVVTALQLRRCELSVQARGAN